VKRAAVPLTVALGLAAFALVTGNMSAADTSFDFAKATSKLRSAHERLTTVHEAEAASRRFAPVYVPADY